jgi:hypothetical protein
MGTWRCVLVLLAGALSALASGCADPANPPSIPRPTDAGFIDWLNGEKITYERGVILDSVWRIDPGEVSDFKVIRITNNPADGIYTAAVSFRATAKGRGIQVSEGVIRYKNASQPGKLQFVDFVPVSVARIGN